MEEYRNDIKEQSKFNMAQLILNNINESFINATNHYRNGKFDRWFFDLKTARFYISGKLTLDEIKELEGMEDGIHKYLYLLALPSKIPKVNKLIEEYLKKIQWHIEHKKIGLVSKQDESIFT